MDALAHGSCVGAVEEGLDMKSRVSAAGLAVFLTAASLAFACGPDLPYHVTGEGAEKLNKGTRNLLTKAYALVHEVCGKKMVDAQICAHNYILMSSGLGSSAAAIVAGLFGANEMQLRLQQK